MNKDENVNETNSKDKLGEKEVREKEKEIKEKEVREKECTDNRGGYVGIRKRIRDFIVNKLINKFKLLYKNE